VPTAAASRRRGNDLPISSDLISDTEHTVHPPLLHDRAHALAQLHDHGLHLLHVNELPLPAGLFRLTLLRYTPRRTPRIAIEQSRVRS